MVGVFVNKRELGDEIEKIMFGEGNDTATSLQCSSMDLR